MRVVVFGYQTWGYRTLEALLASEHEVVLAVTHPASDHAYESIWSDSVAELAQANGIPVVVRNRPDEDVVAAVKDADPDIIVANNWRTWIPPHIYDLPRHGTLNVHDSLLPAYAGFAPVIWALINGEPEVGVTAHLMNETLDAGDIVLQRAVPVGPADTATDLFHRTVDLIGPIVVDALAAIAAGKRDFVAQDPGAGELLPQAVHRGQPDRLRLAGRGPGAAGARAVRPVPERLLLPRCHPPAGRLGGGVGGPVRRHAGADLHQGGRRRGDRRRRGRPPRPQPRPARPPRPRSTTARSCRRRSTSAAMGGYLTSHPA